MLPSHAPVVVIGGGVIGCSTLYHLAKLGVPDAILLERNKLTSGTTWHSAAQVRALRSSRGLTELVKYSVSLYPALEAETEQATGWINKGSLSIATTRPGDPYPSPGIAGATVRFASAVDRRRRGEGALAADERERRHCCGLVTGRRARQSVGSVRGADQGRAQAWRPHFRRHCCHRCRD